MRTFLRISTAFAAVTGLAFALVWLGGERESQVHAADAPTATNRARIAMTAALYKADPTSLREQGVDLGTALPSTTPNAYTTNVVSSVLGERQLSSLVRQLANSDDVQLMSRPQMLTYSSVPGRIKFVGRVRRAVASGIQRVSNDYIDVGTSIDLVPVALENGQIRLTAHVDITTAAGDEKPIESHNMLGQGDLYTGESLVDYEEGNDALLIVTPRLLTDELATSASPARDEPSDGAASPFGPFAKLDFATVDWADYEWKPSNANAQHKLEQLRQNLGPQHPSVVKAQTEFDNIHDHGEKSFPVPVIGEQPKQRDGRRSSRQELRAEIRELHEEVNVLRRDVRRLIEILEVQGAADREATPEEQSSVESNESKSDVSEWPADDPTETAVRPEWKLSLRKAMTVALDNKAVLTPFRRGGDSYIFVRPTNDDLSTSEVAITARNFLRDVEGAYWQLWAAQRDLEASKRAKVAAEALWRKINERVKAGLDSSQSEAESREHYFHCRGLVAHSLAKVGLRDVELRRILGVPSEDGRVILLTDEPETAEVKFDRDKTLSSALANSPELRRQQNAIRQIELELTAARNKALPSDAYQQLGLAAGEKLGFSKDVPLGFRWETAAIRSAELQLARAKAQAEEMKLSLSQLLLSALHEHDVSRKALHVAFGGWQASDRELASVTALREGGKTTLDHLMRAQRRSAQRETEYYAAAARYAIAVRDVRSCRGTLLVDRGFKIDVAKDSYSPPITGSWVPSGEATKKPYTIKVPPAAIDSLRRDGSAFYNKVDEKDQGTRRIRVVVGSDNQPSRRGEPTVVGPVEQGWRQRGNGGLDYYLQLNHQQLNAFAAGAPIDCQVHPDVNSIQNVYVFVGENQLPRELAK